MGREIKFRGLRSDGKGWVYGDIKRVNDNRRGGQFHYIWVDTDDIEDVGRYIMVNSSTVGQFTGLTDRNGKEIYEGDNVLYKTIVKSDENGDSILYEGVIQFWTGQTGCGWRYKSNRYTLMIKRSHAYQMTVIGNIHEK